jgi:predicted NACHT family NTPase
MAGQIYNWKRFWYRRGSDINLNDGGYLPNPDGPYGSILSSNVAAFTDIASTPCLVLLAEPGMGKTQTMQMEKTAIDEAVAQQGGQTLWLNLRSYSSEDRLIRDLFEDPTFLAWRTGSHHLHLFLDSLDEALLRIDTIAALLVDELQKQPIERLALRIACRTAEWPISLETGLRERWGKEYVGVYELAPLRRVDVAEAARANEVDPETFLHLVSENQAVPFAIKPVTPNFLLNTYLQKHAFPGTQTELFLSGCRLLAAESNETRRDARRTGVFSVEQRLHMAGRIAAVMIFANRYAIWTDIDRGNVPE